MQQGWIMLHRKIVNWEWYTDVNTFKLFVHLILYANHTAAKWRGIEVKRGELITRTASLSSSTGLTQRQVRTALGHLRKTGEISVKTTKLYTRITVENYGLYQGFEQLEQNTGDTEATDG